MFSIILFFLKKDKNKKITFELIIWYKRRKKKFVMIFRRDFVLGCFVEGNLETATKNR